MNEENKRMYYEVYYSIIKLIIIAEKNINRDRIRVRQNLQSFIN